MHRYLAMSVGILIIILTLCAWYRFMRRSNCAFRQTAQIQDTQNTGYPNTGNTTSSLLFAVASHLFTIFCLFAGRVWSLDCHVQTTTADCDPASANGFGVAGIINLAVGYS